MVSQHYDIIGDVHGRADQLTTLLHKLGYSPDEQGVYQHPDRKVIFLGDFIDKGPQQRETLDIVRPMMDSGQALSVMGNHEFNAICYATQTEHGFVRSHTDQNAEQHQHFLDAYPFNSEEYHSTIEWFKTLPVYLDLEGLGVVHAFWHEQSFAEIRSFLNNDNTLTPAAYQEFADENSRFYTVIEDIIKGPKHQLPEGITFSDHYGHERTRSRAHWWEGQNIPLSDRLDLNNAPLTPDQRERIDLSSGLTNIFNQPAKPVFIGHYWIKGELRALSNTVACVDYDMAGGRGITAYRWDGEDHIQPLTLFAAKRFIPLSPL